jgi:hypothetical protein
VLVSWRIYLGGGLDYDGLLSIIPLGGRGGYGRFALLVGDDVYCYIATHLSSKYYLSS